MKDFKNFVAWAVKSEFADFIEEALMTFPNYVNSVIEMEIRLPFAYASREGEDLRSFVERLDSNRRIRHERAIDACNQLNRLCANEGITPFFEGDVTDRYAVADFCLEVSSYFFTEGQKIDILEYAKKEEYIDTEDFSLDV